MNEPAPTFTAQPSDAHAPPPVDERTSAGAFEIAGQCLESFVTEAYEIVTSGKYAAPNA
jgi:hypothetical protein